MSIFMDWCFRCRYTRINIDLPVHRVAVSLAGRCAEETSACIHLLSFRYASRIIELTAIQSLLDRPDYLSQRLAICPTKCYFWIKELNQMGITIILYSIISTIRYNYTDTVCFIVVVKRSCVSVMAT